MKYNKSSMKEQKIHKDGTPSAISQAKSRGYLKIMKLIDKVLSGYNPKITRIPSKYTPHQGNQECARRLRR